MPVYELFCLARPQIPRDKLAAVIKTACTSVFSSNGVLTDILSYDLRELAYPIRKAGSKYDEVRVQLLLPRNNTRIKPCMSECSCLHVGHDVADAVSGKAISSVGNESQSSDQ